MHSSAVYSIALARVRADSQEFSHHRDKDENALRIHSYHSRCTGIKILYRVEWATQNEIIPWLAGDKIKIYKVCVPREKYERGKLNCIRPTMRLKNNSTLHTSRIELRIYCAFS